MNSDVADEIQKFRPLETRVLHTFDPSESRVDVDPKVDRRRSKFDLKVWIDFRIDSQSEIQMCGYRGAYDLTQVVVPTDDPIARAFHRTVLWESLEMTVQSYAVEQCRAGLVSLS